MKKACVIIIVSLFYPALKCQDLLSLVSPFLDSAIGQEGAKTSGNGNVIQHFVKFGTNIGQQLIQNQVMNVWPKSSSFSKLSPKESQSLTEVLVPPVPTTMKVIATTPLSISARHDYHLITNNFLGTTRASPFLANNFRPNNLSRHHRFIISQQNQQAVQFHRNPQPQQPSSDSFQSSQPMFHDTVRHSANFGQEVFRLLDEISHYSDVHRQKNQDYQSVQKLLNVFFNSISSGQSDVSRTQRLLPVNDGTETGRNRPIARNLFESDIVLTVDQLKRIVMAEKQQHMGNHRRSRRKVITGSIYRWPRNRNIPYEFVSSDALNFWQRETCVRWEENGSGYDRVIFFRGSGCYSNVGRTGGRQEISIGYGCDNVGIVSHEIGHSLGFWHEQSRPDRDQYIKLQNKYIIRGTQGNFIKRSYLETESMGVPFDLGSVMHYGPNAFSTDWNHRTIETVDKRYSHTIGQRHGPSFIDIKQINRLYCHHKCATSLLACQNGGYPDPNNCQLCKCPTGLGGVTCADVQPSSCGGELIATSVWQRLAYRGSHKCYWRIRADNARIRIEIESAAFRCDTTCQVYVEIKHNSAFEQTGFRICCGSEPVNVLSDQAEVLVIFDAAELGQDGSFSLRYIIDSGRPLPKAPLPIWIPGSEDRLFRGHEIDKNGLVEKFILNAIPKIRDPQQPAVSIASIVTEFTLEKILG